MYLKYNIRNFMRDGLLSCGFVILLINVIIYLTNNLSSNITTYIPLHSLQIKWISASFILILLGYFCFLIRLTKQARINHFKSYINYFPEYISHIIATLSAMVIIMVLITNIKFKSGYILFIFVISFILYVLSKEVKKQKF